MLLISPVLIARAFLVGGWLAGVLTGSAWAVTSAEADRAFDALRRIDWSVPAGSGIQSQSAASAVALVLCFADEVGK